MRQHWSHSIIKYTTLTAIFSGFLASISIAHAESCVCSTGAVVEANQRCPALNAAQQQTELNWVNRHLAKRQLDVEVDKFYSAEVSRVQQGLLDRLSCVEQQRRTQLLPEIAHFNDTRAYSALTAIENLYRYHLTANNRNVEIETYHYNTDNVNSMITLTQVVYDGNHPYHRHDFYNDDRYWREREREEARRRWEEAERDRLRREAIERERIREIFERQRREEEWRREQIQRKEEQRREEYRREQERRERERAERERREWKERKEERREERRDERRDDRRDDRRDGRWDSSRFPNERYRNEQPSQQPTKGVHNLGARVELE